MLGMVHCSSPTISLEHLGGLQTMPPADLHVVRWCQVLFCTAVDDSTNAPSGSPVSMIAC